MKRVLITGSRGFLGQHLCLSLLRDGYEVTGLDRSGKDRKPPSWWTLYPDSKPDQIQQVESDLGSCDQIRGVLEEQSYDFILHLAGTAFVPEGWINTADVAVNNTVVPIRLFQAARDANFKGRIVFVSSGEVYGAKHPMPLLEDFTLEPENPYAESKRSAEQYAGYFVSRGLDIVIARPFNQIGPGQNPAFVIPSFLCRIRDAAARGETEIQVGDLDAERDFLDVRDAARAYSIVAEKGIKGQAYNICSGRPVTIRRVLDLALKVTGANLKPRIDPSLLRDGKSIRYGSCEKLMNLGWSSSVELEESIRDIWRSMQ